VFYSAAFGVEGVFSVAFVDGSVEGAVGVSEGFGHGEGVVEVGEGLVWVFFAGVQDGLGRGFYGGGLFFGGGLGPGVVVVDDVF